MLPSSSYKQNILLKMSFDGFYGSKSSNKHLKLMIALRLQHAIRELQDGMINFVLWGASAVSQVLQPFPLCSVFVCRGRTWSALVCLKAQPSWPSWQLDPLDTGSIFWSVLPFFTVFGKPFLCYGSNFHCQLP